MANGNNGEHVQFTEAPASINLRFDYQGFSGIQLTLRAESGASVLTKLQGALSALGKMGAQPTQSYKVTQANPTASNGGDAPMCPTHQAPMKQSQHGGWFCPKKVADDDGTGRPVYCKQKVK